MIAERYITEWSASFPWTKNSFVEQDMVICRALVDIFSDPFLANALAFRGGTAIHKLHFSPQVRYSEDIDLVQVEPGPVKPITERLGKVLSWLPHMTSEMRRFGFRMKFRYESEIAPIEPMRLKVEVNTFEHFSVLGYACDVCRLRRFRGVSGRLSSLLLGRGAGRRPIPVRTCR